MGLIHYVAAFSNPIKIFWGLVSFGRGDSHYRPIILFDTGTKNQAIQSNEENHSFNHGTYRHTEKVAMLPPSQQSSLQPFYHQHYLAQQSVSPSHYTGQYAYGSHHSTNEHTQYQPQPPQPLSAPLSRNDNFY